MVLNKCRPLQFLLCEVIRQLAILAAVLLYISHLIANDQALTQTDESIKGIVSVMAGSRHSHDASRNLCLHFLALLPVLISFSSSLLSHLGLQYLQVSIPPASLS